MIIMSHEETLGCVHLTRPNYFHKNSFLRSILQKDGLVIQSFCLLYGAVVCSECKNKRRPGISSVSGACLNAADTARECKRSLPRVHRRSGSMFTEHFGTLGMRRLFRFSFLDELTLKWFHY